MTVTALTSLLERASGLVDSTASFDHHMNESEKVDASATRRTDLVGTAIRQVIVNPTGLVCFLAFSLDVYACTLMLALVTYR